MREASCSFDIDKVCPTPVAYPKQMLFQQCLLGEPADKNTAWMDYGMSPLLLRSCLVGRGAAGVG
eukprot:3979277-Amphidinium_carterae.3